MYGDLLLDRLAIKFLGREENCSAGGGGDTEAHFPNPPPPSAGVHVTPPPQSNFQVALVLLHFTLNSCTCSPLSTGMLWAAPLGGAFAFLAEATHTTTQ